MILNREELLKEIAPAKETVSLGNGEVIITDIGASALMELYTRKDVQKDDGTYDMTKFTPALVALAVVDEAGERIFTDDDIAFLQKAGANQFQKLATVARRLNGLAGNEAKN